MHLRPLALVLLVALVPVAAAEPVAVKVMGGFFDPDRVEIQPGDVVTFTNEDAMGHTITSTWDQGASFHVVLRGGESFAHTFDAVGEWGIHCRPHTGMAMTVAVADLPTEAKMPVPAPAILFLIACVVGAALLSRRR